MRLSVIYHMLYHWSSVFFMCHKSYARIHVTYYVSVVMSHASCAMLCVIYHLSCYLSCVICLVPSIMFPMSTVMCHESR